METLRASLLEHLPVTAAAVAAGVTLTGVVHLVTTRSRARSFRPSLQPVGVQVDVAAHRAVAMSEERDFTTVQDLDWLRFLS